MHTHAYKDACAFTHKRAVIVDVGNSGGRCVLFGVCVMWCDVVHSVNVVLSCLSACVCVSLCVCGHTHAYKDARAFTHKCAVVVGVGNSGGLCVLWCCVLCVVWCDVFACVAVSVSVCVSFLSIAFSLYGSL